MIRIQTTPSSRHGTTSVLLHSVALSLYKQVFRWISEYSLPVLMNYYRYNRWNSFIKNRNKSIFCYFCSLNKRIISSFVYCESKTPDESPDHQLYILLIKIDYADFLEGRSNNEWRSVLYPIAL